MRTGCRLANYLVSSSRNRRRENRERAFYNIQSFTSEYGLRGTKVSFISKKEHCTSSIYGMTCFSIDNNIVRLIDGFVLLLEVSTLQR